MKTCVKILLLNFLFISTVLGQSSELMNMYYKTNEFWDKGDYQTAIQWAEKALTLAENEFGIQHKTYTVFLNNLAGLYRSLGRYEQAEPLYKQALVISKRPWGKHILNMPLP